MRNKPDPATLDNRIAACARKHGVSLNFSGVSTWLYRQNRIDWAELTYRSDVCDRRQLEKKLDTLNSAIDTMLLGPGFKR